MLSILKRGLVPPMSPRRAPSPWCATVGVFAFQPKRPREIGGLVSHSPSSVQRSYFSLSKTQLGRPLIPSPSLSSGSARARISSSSIAASSPSPIIGMPMRAPKRTSGRKRRLGASAPTATGS